MISILRSDPILFVLMIPCVLLALTLHEIAHGYVAYRCGDQTAKMMGRFSLNPLKHLDLMGTLMMLLVGFGWAKPVPVNYRNLRKPRRDIALVSLAGPMMNFILTFAATVLYFLFLWLFCGMNGVSTTEAGDFIRLFPSPIVLYSTQSVFSAFPAWEQMVLEFFALFSLVNAGLGVFNLIPLPPLDGSKILASLLPNNLAAKYLRLEQYARFILLGLVAASWVVPQLTNYLFWPVEKLRDLLLMLFEKLMLLFF